MHHPIEVMVRDCTTGVVTSTVAGSEPIIRPLSGGSPTPFQIEREVTVDRVRLIVGTGHGASPSTDRPTPEALSSDNANRTIDGIDTLVPSCLKIALIIDGSDPKGGVIFARTRSIREEGVQKFEATR